MFDSLLEVRVDPETLLKDFIIHSEPAFCCKYKMFICNLIRFYKACSKKVKGVDVHRKHFVFLSGLLQADLEE